MRLFRFEKKTGKNYVKSLVLIGGKTIGKIKFFIKNEFKKCNNHTLFLFLTLKNLRSKLVNKLIQ